MKTSQSAVARIEAAEIDAKLSTLQRTPWRSAIRSNCHCGRPRDHSRRTTGFLAQQSRWNSERPRFVEVGMTTRRVPLFTSVAMLAIVASCRGGSPTAAIPSTSTVGSVASPSPSVGEVQGGPGSGPTSVVPRYGGFEFTAPAGWYVVTNEEFIGTMFTHLAWTSPLPLRPPCFSRLENGGLHQGCDPPLDPIPEGGVIASFTQMAFPAPPGELEHTGLGVYLHTGGIDEEPAPVVGPTA